jgi:glutathione S-transferase
MALRSAAIPVDIREISLRDKPPEMLAISPKGTVPVLQCADGRVIDQSLDIMRWALAQHDPQQWLRETPDVDQHALIACNDTTFKYWLDRYKYAERYPEFTQAYYREQALGSQIAELERLLLARSYIGGATPVLADVAIFPFVRQFAAVDAAWFSASAYPAVRRWLEGWLESELFKNIMAKPSAQ